MSLQIHPGQRWVSETEPELGLGRVNAVGPRTVTLLFSASESVREYALDNAPIRRVRFREGDRIRTEDGVAHEVRAVSERRGLLVYQCDGIELGEADLSDSITFNQPGERLLAGQVDPVALFDLRARALQYQHHRRKSAVRGFVGGRIDLIPHQLSIAAEVSGRLIPRVLLADEVGLGKTIEACLVLHRLLLTGRAQRVLILVPEPLLHQWFVELLRRFNLWFHIFDEERCESIETTNPDANPFLDDQLVLASIGLLTRKPGRTDQAIAAGWDLLIVDEAHHLGWSPADPSPEYQVVERLARGTPGLLLLTATPEQLGMESHFARLRLLDPDRFHDLGAFVLESEGYRQVAALVERLLARRPLDPGQADTLAALLGEAAEPVSARLQRWISGQEPGVDDWIDALLDRHGTGRVMLRNTRHTIQGFPARRARLHPLAPPQEPAGCFERLADEFAADCSLPGSGRFVPDFSNDARLDWLAGLLRELDPAKVLLICRSQAKAEAIATAVQQRINLRQAVFHEGIPLVQRDRSAAWFAEEDGARLLICSEIGSEGRNFQFAHHLVLFDLPLDPELLEQRIGRLDRIGQTSEIQLHVPFVSGSSQEVLVRWFHEALDAFEHNLHGGRELLERVGNAVRDLAEDFHDTGEPAQENLRLLIQETSTARHEIAHRLEQGRDRLLELNSFRKPTADRIAAGITAEDRSPALEHFILAVFEHHGIHAEEIRPRTYRLGSTGVFADTFPGLPGEGLTVTCDRARALAFEQVQFLTCDHPLVTGAIDLLVGSEQGNSCLAAWPDPRETGLYLEAVHMLECVAPAHLHIDRFLPPTPIRILVDQRGQDLSSALPTAALAPRLRQHPHPRVLDSETLREEWIPSLLRQAEGHAQARVAGLVAAARSELQRQCSQEVGRLKELKRVNPSVREAEVVELERQLASLEHHLDGARLRLDSIRLIQRGAIGGSR